MFLDLIVGIFTVANSFIALFIVVYAFMFLNKTRSHKDRRPWDYLFLASIIYLVYTMFLMLLEIYNIRMIFNTLDVYELSVFFQFIYTGLILLAFISQTDLIFNNQVIIIMKKDGQDQEGRKKLVEAVIVSGEKAAEIQEKVSQPEKKPARKKKSDAEPGDAKQTS